MLRIKLCPCEKVPARQPGQGQPDCAATHSYRCSVEYWYVVHYPSFCLTSCLVTSLCLLAPNATPCVNICRRPVQCPAFGCRNPASSAHLYRSTRKGPMPLLSISPYSPSSGFQHHLPSGSGSCGVLPFGRTLQMLLGPCRFKSSGDSCAAVCSGWSDEKEAFAARKGQLEPLSTAPRSAAALTLVVCCLGLGRAAAGRCGHRCKG